jgi:hypothetical protein
MMKRSIQLVFIVAFLTFTPNAFAQKITGIWEGNMRDEYIQVNVEQRGNELCGFTYDYILGDKANHCVAKFEGRYAEDKKIFFLKGNTFIENSGSHVFMQILLWRDVEYGKDVLIGKVYTGGLLGLGGDNIKLRKVSSRPQPVDPGFEPCFPSSVKPVPKKTPVTEKPVPITKKPTPVTPKPKPAIPPAAEKQKPAEKEPVVTAKPKPAEPQLLPTNRSIMENMKARKKTEQSRLEVDVKRINLKVYDNGIIDGDTVSIFFNGKLLLSHQRLSEKPIELNIDLDESLEENEITMFAENLGSIPPNTALIVITAGGKRYELRSKADLQENAVLVIKYKPR